MITKTNEETQDFGQKLATELKSGDILCLYGELGSGKTTLVKGIATGLGVKEQITSPTFTLMNIYKGTNATLVHIDTYRLKNENELLEIGVEDYLGKPNVITIIEWPEKIENLLKDRQVKKIFMQHHEDNGRLIKIS